MADFLVISDHQIVSPKKKIWGSGGWISAVQREPLEWFIFARMLGWKSEVVHPSLIDNQTIQSDCKCIVIACKTPISDPEIWTYIESKLKKNHILLVLKPGVLDESILTSIGINISSKGENIDWIKMKSDICNFEHKLTGQINAFSLFSNKTTEPLWTSSNGNVLITCQFFNSTILGIGFQMWELIDQNMRFYDFLRKLILNKIKKPIAWVDWSGTMALRMDDPGSSETIHNRMYATYNKLSRDSWKELGLVLREHKARLSIGYVNGWIDDPSLIGSKLWLAGKEVKTRKLQIYPSPSIVLELHGKIYNFSEEYQAIKELHKEKLVQIASHGFTHIYPDLEVWDQSADKDTNIQWFREFGKLAYTSEVKRRGKNHIFRKIKDLFWEFWNQDPMVFIFPGEEFNMQAQKEVLANDWKMVSSYYQAIKFENRLCWSQFLCAPYLDQIEFSWAKESVPIIGYFHDFDIYKNGVNWFRNLMLEWENRGINRFIDLDTLFIGSQFELSIIQSSTDTKLIFENPYLKHEHLGFRIKLENENGLITKMEIPSNLK